MFNKMVLSWIIKFFLSCLKLQCDQLFLRHDIFRESFWRWASLGSGSNKWLDFTLFSKVLSRMIEYLAVMDKVVWDRNYSYC